ncbi:MAG: TonB-dependent receptor, partial [bacterium]
AQLTDSRGEPVPRALVQEISVSFQNLPLPDALALLAEKGQFHFNYSLEVIPSELQVSGQYTDMAICIIISALLEGTGVGFIVMGENQVVLVSSEYLEKTKKYTLSGFITDAQTGEALIGTNVSIPDFKAGCTSNVYGFYSLTIPAGIYKINYAYIGYEPKELGLSLDQNIRQNIELQPTSFLGDTVVVNAPPEEHTLRTTEIGTFTLIPKEQSHIPVFLGERDIFRSIQLLPGVTQIREADCGFYVRGGSSDQNLILLDEAPVYNAVHLLGSFSVFNSDVIREAKLIKGSAPAKYGGKLSSVLDIQMREGSSKQFGGKAGIGTVFSRLTLEGPLIKDRASFLVSGRRTYADIFTKFSSDESVRNSQMYFYDFNVKANYRHTEKDRIYLSGYFGRDFLNIEEEEDAIAILWENKTGTLRWNHLFNEKLFSNSSLIFSRFRYGVSNAHDYETVDLNSLVNDLTLKVDFEYFSNPNSVIYFGAQFINHQYEPSRWLINGSEYFDIRIGERRAKEWGGYISQEHRVNSKLKLDYGFRGWMFFVSGRPDLFEIERMDNIPHEFYGLARHGEEQKMHSGFEPRFSANYLINSTTSIKAGYARNYQNVHMLSNATSGTPLNVWHPSSSTIKPQRADQISLGLYQSPAGTPLEMSYEIFYKDMRNQLEYKNGADVLLGSLFESEMTTGRGWAYGIELFVKKRAGHLTGWIGYTWSRSQRKFAEINEGNIFPAGNDKIHDLAIVSIYQMGSRLTLSANWVYQSGAPVTIQYGKYVVDNKIVDAYTARNAYRMPAYHRLDIGFTYRIGKRSELNFTLYNAYGRKNAYAIIFEENENNPQVLQPVRLSLFSFIPSLSYQYTF